MLDRKFIIENADRIKQNCAQRGVKCDVGRLLALETARRQKLLVVEEANRKANETAKMIGKANDAAEREAMPKFVATRMSRAAMPTERVSRVAGRSNTMTSTIQAARSHPLTSDHRPLTR
jgi:seryl-tRNA synthetase